MIRRSKDPDNLTPSDVRHFKQALLAKQQDILNIVISMENEALRQDRTDLSNMPFHIADLGSDNFEREHTLSLTASERRLLMEIEDALIRIENGTYGLCEGNGERIPKARLRAVPWARYCLKCATLSEMGLLGGGEDNEESDY
ncbi:MAG: TraR/DksA C4-type zinc finger protein [Sedimentisphaerales bacterium]|nr:TraR/DksA C4-type zinc finger protein [Sedimentisphaerales bacterium]